MHDTRKPCNLKARAFFRGTTMVGRIQNISFLGGRISLSRGNLDPGTIFDLEFLIGRERLTATCLVMNAIRNEAGFQFQILTLPARTAINEFILA